MLDGRSAVDDCSHAEADLLPGHISADGLEWNTDLYYVEWDAKQAISWKEAVLRAV